MLKKKNRVKKDLFRFTVKKGLIYFSQNLSLKIIKTEDNQYKFGVSVSKKELKSAVKRNLLKRKALSILKRLEIKTNIQSGFSCVIFFKKGALDVSHQKLQDEMVFLLKKARVI